MSTSLVLGVGLRCLVLLAVWAGGQLVARTDDAPDANIGLGLLVFAVVALVAGVWAALDAHRRGFRPTIGVWAVVAVVTAVLQAISITVLEGDPDASVLASDLVVVAPFLLLVALVPAAAGAAIGAATRRSAAATPER